MMTYVPRLLELLVEYTGGSMVLHDVLIVTVRSQIVWLVHQYVSSYCTAIVLSFVVDVVCHNHRNNKHNRNNQHQHVMANAGTAVFDEDVLDCCD